jgi:hypothetical protein
VLQYLEEESRLLQHALQKYKRELEAMEMTFQVNSQLAGKDLTDEGRSVEIVASSVAQCLVFHGFILYVQFLYTRLKTGRIILWRCPSVRGHFSFPDFFLLPLQLLH